MVIWEATRVVVVEVVGNTRSHFKHILSCRPVTQSQQVTKQRAASTSQVQIADLGVPRRDTRSVNNPPALWARACWTLRLHTLPSKGRVYPSFFLPRLASRIPSRMPGVPLHPLQNALLGMNLKKNISCFFIVFYSFFRAFRSCVPGF